MTATGGPRLAPLPVDRWDPEGRRRLMGHLAVADRYLSGEPDAPPLPNILGLFGHHPDLGASWLALNRGFLESTVLDPRDRELLILRVAERTGCRYEWDQHVRMGGAAGLGPEEVAAVTRGPDDGRWSARDRDLLVAVDRLLDRHGLDDDAWRGLAAHFDERQLLEVLFVVGSYLCLALVLNSVGLEPDAGGDAEKGADHPEPVRSEG